MSTATARKAAEPTAIRVSQSMNLALSRAAKDLKTTRASIVKHALTGYLEDLADGKIIETRRGEKGYTLAEVKAELGL
jgi:predicted DNA-binding protein